MVSRVNIWYIHKNFHHTMPNMSSNVAQRYSEFKRNYKLG